MKDCLKFLIAGDDAQSKDLKRKSLVVKFFVEWVQKLEEKVVDSS